MDDAGLSNVDALPGDVPSRRNALGSAASGPFSFLKRSPTLLKMSSMLVTRPSWHTAAFNSLWISQMWCLFATSFIFIKGVQETMVTGASAIVMQSLPSLLLWKSSSSE